MIFKTISKDHGTTTSYIQVNLIFYSIIWAKGLRKSLLIYTTEVEC